MEIVARDPSPLLLASRGAKAGLRQMRAIRAAGNAVNRDPWVAMWTLAVRVYREAIAEHPSTRTSALADRAVSSSMGWVEMTRSEKASAGR